MIEKFNDVLNRYNRIVFFSGAGMSTASGIPDFRSSTGLFKNIYHAEEAVSHDFFISHPDLFFEFYRSSLIYPSAKPNAGHHFIAELEKKKKVTVITQNIDNLHQKAGSSDVLELHGSVYRNYCVNCGKSYDLMKIQEEAVPHCECGGIIKPDVVLYGEQLNDETLYKSIDAISKAEVMVILGTSLNVYPAAGLVRYFRGHCLIIINRDETPYDHYADIVIHDDINNVFSKLSIQ